MQLVCKAAQPGVHGLVAAQQGVVAEYGGDGDGQTRGGHDECLTDGAGDLVNGGVAGGADAHEGVVDAPDGAEQPDEGGGGADGGEDGQARLLARGGSVQAVVQRAGNPVAGVDGLPKLLRLFARVNAGGQTILMVTHSVRAASTAGRVLFIRDGVVFHQLYRGGSTDTGFYQKIADTLTLLQTGGELR